MSYNGIGLSTPRGSGTSGHIQANRSNLRSRPQFDKQGSSDFRSNNNGQQHRAPDQSILDHERKRRIESKCFELQVQLEDEGLLSTEQIEQKVDELRQELLSKANSGQKEGLIKPSERHELAKAKMEQDEKFRKALGIKEGHVEGLAFDREAQQEIKRQKAEEREKAKEERAKIQQDLEKARAKAMERRREMEDERRDHEEKMRRERKEHEEKMREDRRKMEVELEARRRGQAPTAETRGGKSSAALPYDDDNKETRDVNKILVPLHLLAVAQFPLRLELVVETILPLVPPKSEAVNLGGLDLPLVLVLVLPPVPVPVHSLALAPFPAPVHLPVRSVDLVPLHRGGDVKIVGV
ncbi:hypothetical protein JCM3765_007238 [Sporobolomyces pararoseus]